LSGLGTEADKGISAQNNTSVFAGPTSSNFSFSLARLMLDQENAQEGRTTDPDLDPDLAGSVSLDKDTDEDEEAGNAQASDPHQDFATSNSLHGMQKSHALELIRIYNECVGVLHPIADISALNSQVDLLWPDPDLPCPDQKLIISSGNQFTHLRMVLAIGLLAEGGGSCATSEKIYNELQPAVTRVVFAKSFNLHGQILLLLMVSHH